MNLVMVYGIRVEYGILRLNTYEDIVNLSNNYTNTIGHGEIPFIQLDLPRTSNSRQARVLNQTREITKATTGRVVGNHHHNDEVPPQDTRLSYPHSVDHITPRHKGTFADSNEQVVAYNNINSQKTKGGIGSKTNRSEFLIPSSNKMSSDNHAVYDSQAAP